MWYDTLALISTIIVIALLRRLVSIFPSLMACLLRWKENINLQVSLKMRTDRDILTCALFIPFCLTVFRFQIYSPGFMSGLGDCARLWCTVGITVGYTLVRIACRLLFRLHSTPTSIYKTANDSVRTYFIILTLILMTTGEILSFFNTPLEYIRTAMFWISGTIYVLFLVRKTQIFLTSCNLFASFLYLCALEILPTGVLIASAVIF